MNIIENISTTFQEDVVFFAKAITGRLPKEEHLQTKICLAVTRMFALLGMAFMGVGVISALSMVATAPMGAVLTMALALSGCVLAHDIFILAKNATKQMNIPNLILAKGKAFWQDLLDFQHGKKPLNGVPRQAITEGTHFRILWDALIGVMIERQRA